MKKITSFLWFDNQAEEAVKFYTSCFENSRFEIANRYDEAGAKATGMPAGAVMTMPFELEGQEFVALNGGPVYKFNMSVSFMVNCKTENKIDELWKKLSPGGIIRMDLDKYPFSEKFGWVTDKYGISWQLNLTESPQPIVPFLWFNDSAERAMQFYTSVFRNSKILNTMFFGKKDKGPEGLIKNGLVSLNGQLFMTMDSNKEHFNPAISFVINCENQEEVDYYWDKLSEGGDERAQQCGWLQDKFGVSWQVVPDILPQLLNGSDPEKSQRAMQAMLKMKKLVIQDLMDAYES